VMHQQAGKNHVEWANGDATGHEHHHGANATTTNTHGGLVTPPSPRSQSSDSGRYARRRRRRRSSGSENGGRSRSSSASAAHGHEDVDADSGVEMDAKVRTMDIDDAELSSTTLAEEEDDPAVAAVLPIAEAQVLGGAGGAAQSGKEDPERSLATPESSVYKLDSSLGSDSYSVGKQLHPLSESTLSDTREELEGFDSSSTADSTMPDSKAAPTSHYHQPTISTQAAVGVVLLSVATAAVFWKIKPE